MVYQGKQRNCGKRESRLDNGGLLPCFVILGWLNIYAASYDLENATGLFDLSGRSGMQLVWIALPCCWLSPWLKLM